MWGHISDERLTDLLEGRADAGALEHVSRCERCTGRLEAARFGLTQAHQADVPEPSPLYWEAFRRQVDRRVGAERAAVRMAWRPALAAAAALAAAFALLPPSPRGGVEPAPTLPAWSALPPAAEDPGFAVLQGLGAEEEDLVGLTSQRGIAGLVAGLSQSERQDLARALQAELRGGQS